MLKQHLTELFIDGIKVDQWTTEDDDEVPTVNSQFPGWIMRDPLTMPEAKNGA